MTSAAVPLGRLTPDRRPGAARWSSPLGMSAAMFLLSGALYALIGVLTPVMMDTDLGRQLLMMSPRTDALLFGAEPSAILDSNPEMVQLREVMAGFVGGILVAIGVLIATVAWFGLRARQPWALIALSATGLLVLPFWYLSFRPYLAAGIAFGLSDLPPIFWIPAGLLLPAAILGAVGLRGRSAGTRSLD